MLFFPSFLFALSFLFLYSFLSSYCFSFIPAFPTFFFISLLNTMEILRWGFGLSGLWPCYLSLRLSSSPPHLV